MGNNEKCPIFFDWDNRLLHLSSKPMLSKYSKRALNRVWKAIRFSWWMTVTFHKFPNQSDFDQKMQETEIEYLENSEVAQKSFAENYVGLPF